MASDSASLEKGVDHPKNKTISVSLGPPPNTSSNLSSPQKRIRKRHKGSMCVGTSLQYGIGTLNLAIPDFDLVRIYHPDKADPSISPEDAHATFRSITAAYDSLRGKTPLTPSPFSAPAHERHRTTAEWTVMRTKREALYAGADDRWKDKVILAGLIAVGPFLSIIESLGLKTLQTVVILVAQIITTRRQALAGAVAQSRQWHETQTKQTKQGIASLETKGSDKRLSG
jgi:hypothetical protein